MVLRLFVWKGNYDFEQIKRQSVRIAAGRHTRQASADTQTTLTAY